MYQFEGLFLLYRRRVEEKVLGSFLAKHTDEQSGHSERLRKKRCDSEDAFGSDLFDQSLEAEPLEVLERDGFVVHV